LKSLEKLLSIYEDSVGEGGQLMLGLAPDRRGLLPEVDVKRLEELGAAIQRRYGHNLVAGRSRSIPGDSDAALDGDANTFWSAPAGSHHAILEVDFAKPIKFDHALTMEWLNTGQNVQHYKIEIWDGKVWLAVAEGHPIGHKKIDRFPAVTASRVRLNILASSSEAHIREFQLFFVGE
jgi:alpha-L-fucosidase